MSDELKPCKHCGGEARFQIFDTTCNVECRECGIGTRNVLLDNYQECIYKWNRSADDAQVIKNAENYKLADDSEPQVIATSEKHELTANDNLSAEFDISADGHARNDTETVDSREQLEADVIKMCHMHTLQARPFLDLLDRQAAITERECQLEYDAVVCDRDYFRKHVRQMNEFIDKLTAERDELREELRIEREAVEACEGCDKVDSLTAERDEFADELKLDAIALDELRKQVDELTAERDDLRRITKELEERNGELLEGRAHWIDQAVSIYRHFYPHNEYGVPDDVCGMVIAKIDELTAERDELGEMRERYARALNQIADALGVDITDDAETHAREMAAIEKLKAERDDLRERLDAMKSVLDKWVKQTVGEEPPEHPIAQLQPNDGDSRKKLEADVADMVGAEPLYATVIGWLDRQDAITQRWFAKEQEGSTISVMHYDGILRQKVDSLTAELKEAREGIQYLVIECNVLDDKLAVAQEMLYVVMDGGEPDYEKWMWNHDGLSDWFKENFTKTVPQLEAERDYWKDQVHQCVIKAVEPGGYTAGIMRYPRTDGYCEPSLMVTDAIDSLKDFYADEKRMNDKLTAELERKQRVIDVQRESFRKIEADCKRLANENECFRKHGTPF